MIYGSENLHVFSKVSVFSTLENIVAETSENVFLEYFPVCQHRKQEKILLRQNCLRTKGVIINN